MEIFRTDIRQVNKVFGLVAATGFLLVAASANAQFVGDTVNATYFFPTSTNVYQDLGSQVISPSASFTFVNGISAYVNSVSIALNLNSNIFGAAPFNGAVFTDLTKNNIVGASLDAGSNFAGFDASRLTFTSNSVSFNFQGLLNAAPSFIQANVQFSTNAGAVPEPTTWAMMLVGFASIGAATRSRRLSKSVAA